MIPVARNVWQQISASSPAARRAGGSCGRRRRGASAVSVSSPVRPRAERKRGVFFASPNLRRFEVGVEIGFEIVVRRHFVALAAFFVQAHPPAFALAVIVLDAHGDGRADAREGIGHQGDQRAVAQADDGRDVDAVEQLARLGRRSAPASCRA